MASPEGARGKSAQAAKLLNRLTREIHRTVAAPGRDQVHDLRVASRRFGQIVNVLEDAGARGTGRIRRRIKEMIRLAGAVRDYDIAVKLLAKFAAPSRLHARLQRRRAEAERELTAALRRWIDQQSGESWKNKLPFDRAAIAAATRQMLDRRARQLFERADIDGPPGALHKLRIAAKKLRYTMELASFTPARIAPIKALQSKLGDINDYESARRIAAKEGASKTLIQSLIEAQDKKTRQFRRYWKREFAGKEKGWLAILTTPPRNR
jgi:CHAD domain-containing protein